MKAKDMLQNANNIICNHHDFFSPAACAVEWHDAVKCLTEKTRWVPSNVPTACICGDEVFYNPEFIESLNQQQVTGLVIHELLHMLLDHPERLRPLFEQDHRLANIAADYEINNMVTTYNADVAFPIVLPPEGFVDVEKYGGLSAEVIFRKLQEEEQQKQQQQKQQPQPQDGDGNGKPQDGNGQPQDGNGKPQDGDGKPQDGNGKPQDGNGKPQDGNGNGNGKPQQKPSSCGEFQPNPDKSKGKQESDQWREILASSIQTAKLRGSGGGAFIEKLEKSMDSELDLESILEKYADQFCLSDDSTMMDRRYMANYDIGAVGMESLRHGTLVFVKDTSGSVDTQQLEVVIGILQRVSERLNPERLIVIDADEKVCHVEELLPYDEIPMTCKGRGGTDFRPAFDWIANEISDARAIVYLTDGYGAFPDEEPDIPTLWLTYGLQATEYPFGDVLNIVEIIESARA